MVITSPSAPLRAPVTYHPDRDVVEVTALPHGVLKNVSEGRSSHLVHAPLLRGELVLAA
jgi:hypothetical protein